MQRDSHRRLSFAGEQDTPVPETPIKDELKATAAALPVAVVCAEPAGEKRGWKAASARARRATVAGWLLSKPSKNLAVAAQCLPLEAKQSAN